MKICRSCDSRFDSAGWRCSSCGHTPLQDGFVRLADDLAELTEAYGAEDFTRVAEAESLSFWARRRNKLIVWALRAYFPDASSMFEVGCGTGIVLGAVRKAFPALRLSGGDPYRPALEVARSVAGVELLQVDALALPFEEEFDVVGAFDVLEHLDDDRGALKELHRSLRPGGGLLVTVPQHPRLWSAADDWALHRRRYSRAALLRAVTAAGFEIRRVTSFVSLLLPAMASSRALQRPGSSYDPCREFRVAKPLAATLAAILAFEASLIRRGVSFPAGGSLLVVARRAPRAAYPSERRALVEGSERHSDRDQRRRPRLRLPSLPGRAP